jgi:chitinase
VPYLSSATPLGSAGCSLVSYEDAQSITEKGAFVRAQGLGGTIIWTISQGPLANQPVGQRDPLLDAVRAAYLN